MAKFMNNPLILIFFQLSLVIVGALPLEADEDRKVYIVYMGSISEEYSMTSEYHVGILQQVLQGSTVEESLVRSYRKGFNGFAARLTKEEGETLKSMKGVVTVFPSRTLELQTTRSWDFMGFPKSAAPKNKSAESEVILGVIDSGIWPESHSFNDGGFGPPPKKWKGVCKGGANFTCNNKLIGARTYFESARDDIGHGTHTASTAAGRVVDHTGFYGLAEGSARGAVPSARVAVYKVCAERRCQEENILAAFDEAIADGVDLITVSIGATFASDMYTDSIAIGSFHAMQKGILTMHSAGNNGNDSASIASVAPWLCTVAAGNTDRRILDKLVLGNGKTLVGNSINAFSLNGEMFPLVYGEQASSNCSSESFAKMCTSGCVDEKLVKGKILVCDDELGIGIEEGLRKGALGVLARTSDDDVSEISPMPAIEFKTHEFEALLSYLNSTKAPKATILKSEPYNDTTAPVVASFSSRGPNVIASDILKPDISAPGVEILAAFSPKASVSKYNSDTRKVNYTILSGTSMAGPHVAGAAAYLKSLHPDWSPSAIKSALMTTASPMSPSKNPDAEFAYGSGHLNPLKAANPGLVYESTLDEYLLFLCKLGYTHSQITTISGNKTFSCPRKSNKSSAPKDLNYPTMSVLVDTGKSFNVKFSRTVTNVGVANSTYTAKVESAKSITVTVNPNSLSFTSLNEKKMFNVTVVSKGLSASSLGSASLVWSDGVHTFRSSVVVYTRSY